MPQLHNSDTYYNEKLQLWNLLTIMKDYYYTLNGWLVGYIQQSLKHQGTETILCKGSKTL